jgi:hypothetical protein
MEVIYHPKAGDEMLESAKFYEQRSNGLGWRFLSAVRDAEVRIANLLFHIDNDNLFVVAVAHQRRRPAYWRRRLRRRA